MLKPMLHRHLPTATVLAVLATLLGLLLGAGPAQADVGGRLTVSTVPATPGTRIVVEGVAAVTDGRGVARLHVSTFAGLDQRVEVPPTQVSDRYRVKLDRIVESQERGPNASVVIGLRTERLVRWNFVDTTGRSVPDSRVSQLELKSSIGQTVRVNGDDIGQGQWLSAGRVQQVAGGLVFKPMRWSITHVIVDGAEVVNRDQQVFLPGHPDDWNLELLFYTVKVTGRDLFFGSMAGDGVKIVRPDGTVARVPFDAAGAARFSHLARGQYDVTVYGPGLSFARPMSISRNEVVAIEVITPLDLILAGSLAGVFAVSLVLIGRRHRIRNLWARLTFPRGRVVVALLALGVTLPALLLGVGPLAGSAAHGATLTADDALAPNPPPTFAYYYIWYQPTSWQRAKEDYPLLGRYSSGDPVIMRRHVMMAKAAGLTGFLVSWKDSGQLSKRLATLVKVAQQADFKLEIIYQGLDFSRNPLPVEKVAADLETFASTYASNPVFDAFGKPVVVITGTERYSVAQLSEATKAVRGRLQILASAKSAEEYRRTAGILDGDAYYWSSADPRNRWYRPRLRSIATEVRADHGLWIAPAPSGFDARQIGGHLIVPRQNGRMLKLAIAAARSSRPDAVAVISWNEFSENSHIEPSVQYGDRELRSLAQVLGGRVRLPAAMLGRRDAGPAGLTAWQALIVVLTLLGGVVSVGVLKLRRRSPPGSRRSGGGARTIRPERID